jgi:hypothetical protein
MKNLILQNLKSIDIFGVPNSLLLGRKLVYRSKFSGFISIWIYLTMFIISGLEISKTLNRFFFLIHIFSREDAEIKILTD